MVAIILLNWNGADDTLACLDSLTRAAGDFITVIVDNGSTDDSISRITAWQRSHPAFHLDLLAETENHGFARGCNIGIKHALVYQPEAFLLLNNDTEVNPDFLIKLLAAAHTQPSLRVLMPRINYYSQPETIWLCGGHLTFGSRKRLYHNMHQGHLHTHDIIPVTFVSGCALLFFPELLDSDGNVFSERFFFSEEDFEFSLRMRQRGVHMACVPQSVIYHKVGVARGKLRQKQSYGKDYAYYVAKLLACRMHYPAWQFRIILLLHGMKSAVFFHRDCGSWTKAVKLSRRMAYDATHQDAVTRSFFQQCLQMQ